MPNPPGSGNLHGRPAASAGGWGLTYLQSAATGSSRGTSPRRDSLVSGDTLTSESGDSGVGSWCFPQRPGRRNPLRERDIRRCAVDLIGLGMLGNGRTAASESGHVFIWTDDSSLAITPHLFSSPSADPSADFSPPLNHSNVVGRRHGCRLKARSVCAERSCVTAD